MNYYYIHPLLQIPLYATKPFLRNIQSGVVKRPILVGAFLIHKHHYSSRNDKFATSLAKRIERIGTNGQIFIESTLYRYAPKLVYDGYIKFRKGVTQLWLDRAQYKKIKQRMIEGKSLEHFSIVDQELYQVMKRDYRKIAPMVVAIIVPFGWIYFPIALVFSKYLLPHQFLSSKQLEQREMADYRRRVRHYTAAFKHLQAAMTKAPKRQQQIFTNVVQKLEKGEFTLDHVCQHLSPTFEGASAAPVALEALSLAHIIQLCECHSLLPWISWFGISKLHEQAHAYWCLDVAISREGLENLHPRTLTRLCMSRGLNPTLSRDKQVEWLRIWLSLSKQSRDRSHSLLLHQAFLMPYSSPLWPPLRRN